MTSLGASACVRLSMQSTLCVDTHGCRVESSLNADGVEMTLMIIASLGQALAGQAHAVNIFGVLIVWRFIMGVGIGGDYPLSSVIPSEFASTKMRGRMMVAVGANQGWGQLGACFEHIFDVRGLTLVLPVCTMQPLR